MNGPWTPLSDAARSIFQQGGSTMLLSGAVSLVCVSAIAALAVREARGTSHEVRASTDLWNAYQQARYSVVREALLTQGLSPCCFTVF